APKPRAQSDSVITFQTADLADFDAVVCIHHYDFGSMRKVRTPRSRIDCDVVEILAAAFCRTERNFLEQVITPCGRCRQNNHRNPENTQSNRHAASITLHRTLP